LFQEQTTFIL